MRTSRLPSIPLPLSGYAPRRGSLAAAAVVLLLSGLFAGAILAALQPHPPVDVTQASVQGGL